MMKLKEIQTIIKDFEKSELTRLEIETDEFKIKLSKNKDESIISKDDTKVVASPLEQVKVVANENLVLVKSPLVGTCYLKPNPDEKPYVNVGDIVKKGDTLCLIEAMKIMNEIVAPEDGKIVEIVCQNQAFVGFEQVLFKIGNKA